MEKMFQGAEIVIWLFSYVAVADDNEDSERQQTLWSQPVSEDVDIDLKVIVPTGYVFAVNRLNPSHTLWQQKVCEFE